MKSCCNSYRKNKHKNKKCINSNYENNSNLNYSTTQSPDYTKSDDLKKQAEHYTKQANCAKNEAISLENQAKALENQAQYMYSDANEFWNQYYQLCEQADLYMKKSSQCYNQSNNLDDCCDKNCFDNVNSCNCNSKSNTCKRPIVICNGCSCCGCSNSN